MIEYLDGGKFICGYVLENGGKRLHVVNQNGRDVNLPLTRIIHHSDRPLPRNLNRVEILRQLQNMAKRRQELAAAVTLEEIWNLVSEEPQTVFEPRLLAELLFPSDTADDHIAAFLRAVFQDRLFFKYKEGKVIAHSAEVVENLRIQQEKEQQREELLQRGADGLARLMQDAEPDDWPERETCLQLLRDYYLFENEAPESEVAREMLKRARLTGPHDPFLLLVKAGIWDPNENIALLRSDLPVRFSEAALKQAGSLTEADAEMLIGQGRKDFRNLPLLTIDGKLTRDFDDALHLEKQGENYLVGVHIADVAHYIKPGSPLFDEALARGTSIYFPEGTLPMLPPAVSEGLCSLIAGRQRPALSFMILLSPTAEILDLRLVPSVVTVNRQLNYAEVNELIGIDVELTILCDLSRKLRERRLAAGALILPFPEVEIFIGPGDDVEIRLADSETPSRVLISEFMILANTLAAAYLADRETPGLFRSQPAPRQRLVQGYERDLFTIIRQRKNLSPMTLSVRAKPHSSLGVQQYTTVTSPIRRLLDLIIQHQLLHLLSSNAALFSKADLRVYADTIKNLQVRINTAKQLRQRYWILKHLESKAGERIPGMIINRGTNRVHILLTEYMLDTDLPASQVTGRASPGDIIMVRIARVDALGNQLRVEW